MGPAHSSGQGLAYYIATQNGTVVTRSSISSLSKSELSSPEISEKIKELTKNIIEKEDDPAIVSDDENPLVNESKPGS